MKSINRASHQLKGEERGLTVDKPLEDSLFTRAHRFFRFFQGAQVAFECRIMRQLRKDLAEKIGGEPVVTRDAGEFSHFATWSHYAAAEKSLSTQVG